MNKSTTTVSPSRRQTLKALTALGTTGLLSAVTAAESSAPQSNAEAATQAVAQLSEQRFQVVMLVHPNMTALDLVGPQLVFSTMSNVDVHLAWKDLNPVTTDSGLKIVPSMSLDKAPTAPDILFVPGGLGGTTAMMRDAQVVDFVRTRGEKAKWVASVCTGSLLLGAAGLLKGYRATAHWYVRDILPVFGAIPVAERVVIDRNRITGGGVTAGIDMALTVSAMIRGEDFARRQTLAFEYAPLPPYVSGTPELAGETITQGVLQRRRPAINMAREAAVQARSCWKL